MRGSDFPFLINTTPSAPTGAKFWQPKQPLLWLYLTLIVVYFFVLLVPLIINTATVVGFISAIIIVGIQTVVLWFVGYAIPQFRRQPLSLRLFAIAVGAFVAVGAAIMLNALGSIVVKDYGLETIGDALTAPIFEDISRVLGVLVILTLASRGRITVMDGAVYGFLTGMGFELFETVIYIIGGSNLIENLVTGITRTLIGFGLHALWTTAGGAALAYCLSRKQRGLSGNWLVLPAVMLVPMTLHGLWDLTPQLNGFLVVYGLLFLLFAASVGVFLISVRAGRIADWQWIRHTPVGSNLTREHWKALSSADRKRITQQAQHEDEDRSAPVADADAEESLPQ